MSWKVTDVYFAKSVFVMIFFLQPSFDKLWSIYIDPFLNDELLLVAAFVDLRFGPKILMQYDEATANAAAAAVKVRLARAWQQHEEQYKQTLVARANPTSDEEDTSPTAEMPSWSRLCGVSQDLLPKRPFSESVEVELARFGALAVSLDGTPRERIEPLAVLRNNNLKLVYSVACDVLSVPAGEAAAERLFSRSKAVFRPQRQSMSSQVMEQLTLISKNKEFC